MYVLLGNMFIPVAGSASSQDRAYSSCTACSKPYLHMCLGAVFDLEPLTGCLLNHTTHPRASTNSYGSRGWSTCSYTRISHCHERRAPDQLRPHGPQHLPSFQPSRYVNCGGRVDPKRHQTPLSDLTPRVGCKPQLSVLHHPFEVTISSCAIVYISTGCGQELL